jgi:hypothetical protein
MSKLLSIVVVIVFVVIVLHVATGNVQVQQWCDAGIQRCSAAQTVGFGQ